MATPSKLPPNRHVSFEWHQCAPLPVGMRHAKTVFFQGRLHVGGGITTGGVSTDCLVYTYDPYTNIWGSLPPAPVYYAAPIVFNNALHLIGGRLASNNQRTNKVWTFDEPSGKWVKSIPPMRTSRSSATAVAYNESIILAGGIGEGGRHVNTIEVFWNGIWREESVVLPKACSWMKFAIHGDKLYLAGGLDQGTNVFCAQLEFFLHPVNWVSRIQVFSSAPYLYSTIEISHGLLLGVGGQNLQDKNTISIYSYSPLTSSWVEVGVLQVACGAASICYIQMPYGGLFVIGGSTDVTQSSTHVFRAQVITHPDSLLDINFHQPKQEQSDEFAATIINEISPAWLEFGIILKLQPDELEKIVSIYPNDPQACCRLMFEKWLCGMSSIPATWSALLQCLKEFGMEGLASTIEAELKQRGITPEYGSERNHPDILPKAAVSKLSQDLQLQKESLEAQNQLLLEKNEQIHDLKQEAAKNEQESEGYKQALIVSRHHHQSAIADRERTIQIQTEAIAQRDRVIDSHRRMLAEGSARAEELAKTKCELEGVRVELQSRDRDLSLQQRIIQQKDLHLVQQRQELVSKQQALSSSQSEVLSLRSAQESQATQLDRLQTTNKQKEEEILQLRRELESLNEEIQSQKEAMPEIRLPLHPPSQVQEEIHSTHTESYQLLKEQLESKEEQLLKAESLQYFMGGEADSLREDLMEKILEIESLKKREKELQLQLKGPEHRERAVQTHAEPTKELVTTSYLRGTEVIGETSFTLFADKEETFPWPKYGFKLHVPRRALPSDVTQCQIGVKACLSGLFQFPEGCTLVSGVYCITTPHKFEQPLTIEIQHCVSITHPDQCSSLAFVVAKCNQEELPYNFRVLSKGQFAVQSSYGSLSVHQFSLFGIIQWILGEQPTRCCARVFYIPKSVNSWKMDFVITRDIAICNTVVHDNYSSQKAECGPDQEVVFKEDEITLSIPDEGLTLQSGWTITPLMHPGITRKQVDGFQPGCRIPSCQLLLEWASKDANPVRALHKVDLLGAREPFNYFSLECDPLSQDSHVPHVKDQSTGVAPLSKGALEREPQLSELMNKVAAKIPHKWRDVGIQLGVTQSELEAFRSASPSDTNSHFGSVFSAWKCHMTIPYTWSSLIQALEAPAVGEVTLAEELKNQLTRSILPT